MTIPRYESSLQVRQNPNDTLFGSNLDIDLEVIPQVNDFSLEMKNSDQIITNRGCQSNINEQLSSIQHQIRIL